MASTMRYREIIPGAPLNTYVECFWTLESSAPSTHPERILPDGCIELILNFGDRFSQHCETRVTTKEFLVGQMTGPIMISPSGSVQLIGIRFHPGGTLPFLCMPLHELTDHVVELGSLSSGLERDLLATSESQSLPEKIRAIEKFLTRRLTNDEHDPRLMKIAARIVDSRGLIAVDELAADAYGAVVNWSGVFCARLVLESCSGES